MNYTLTGFKKRLVVIAVSGASFGGSAAVAAETVRYTGNAYDLKTGAFVYSENHAEVYEKGIHTYSKVSYRDQAGKEFASKLITFAPNRFQPTYELKDSRDGYTEGIRREGARTVYFARRNSQEQLKEKSLQTPEPAVFDGGFDYFVRENFAEICSGRNKSFFFAVPIKLDYFHFRVARKELGEFCRINLEPENLFVRQFVKPIRLWYDTGERRLRKYEGISNINGPDGKSLKVRVVFSYPQKK